MGGAIYDVPSLTTESKVSFTGNTVTAGGGGVDNCAMDETACPGAPGVGGDGGVQGLPGHGHGGNGAHGYKGKNGGHGKTGVSGKSGKSGTKKYANQN